MSLVTVLLILVGAAVLGRALLEADRVSCREDPQEEIRWRLLVLLGMLFVAACIVPLRFVDAGRAELIGPLVGGIFLGGSAFVLLVARLGGDRVRQLSQSEIGNRWFREAVEAMADGLVLTDPADRILHVNPSLLDGTGYEEWELNGQSVDVLLQPIDPPADDARPSQERAEVEWVCRSKDGATRDVLVSTRLVCDDHAVPHGTVYVAHDLSARMQADRVLRERERRYSLAAEGAGDGLWDWDLRADRVFFSANWKQMLGLDAGDSYSHISEWFSRIHPEDLGRVRSQMDRHVAGDSQYFVSEHRLLHCDGDYRHVLVRGAAERDEQNRAYRVAGFHRDVTDRKRAEERLVHCATHDVLTELPNGLLFDDRLLRAIEFSRRGGSLFSVLCLNLDRFKVINDSVGNSLADDVLAAAARRLRSCMRGTDTVARLAGDEFVILLEQIGDVSDAIRVANRVQSVFAGPFDLGGQEIFVSASIGIVLSETGYDTPKEVLRDAHVAMSRAKADGGNRYEIFDEAMRGRMIHRLHIESELRRAIEREELRVHYQPIVQLAGRRLVGLEALVRWEHPERGMIPPGEFIELAESSSLIIPLDRWVLREACRSLAVWRQRYPLDPPLSVSVNLSSKQVTQPDLVEFVESLLRETRLPAGSLNLELTESAFLDASDANLATLVDLRALGVRLKVDDFGTGYSSLSYLHRLPIQTLKIDRSFVRDMHTSPANLAIVHTIVMLAQALDLQTVAEGVETEEQAAQLCGLHCELAQGFLFARPLTPADTELLLARTMLQPLVVPCQESAADAGQQRSAPAPIVAANDRRRDGGS